MIYVNSRTTCSQGGSEGFRSGEGSCGERARSQRERVSIFDSIYVLSRRGTIEERPGKGKGMWVW